MNKKTIVGLIAGLICLDSFGQNDPVLEDFQPSSLNQPGKEYPMAVQELQDKDIKAVSYVSDDTGHEYLTWRRSLYQLAPLLFQ